MANFFKYTPKGSDGKLLVPEEAIPWYKTDQFFRLGLAVVFLAISLLFFPQPESFKYAELKEGSISNEEIIAPFTFYVEKSDQELEQEKETVRRSIPPVFNYMDSVKQEAIQSLDEIQDSIRVILLSTASDSLKKYRINLVLNQHRIALGRDRLEFFLHLRGDQTQPRTDLPLLKTYFNQLESILSHLYEAGIINVNKDAIKNDKNRITILRNKKEEERSIAEVFELNEARQYLLNRLRSVFGDPSDSVKIGYALLDAHLRPNLYFNEEETSRRIREAIAKIPRVKGTILAGERIIDSHQRVTREHVDILRSLAREIRARRAGAGILSEILLWLGKLLLIILTQIPLVLFLYFHRRRVWEDRRLLFIIVSSMLFVEIAAYGVLYYQMPKYLIPVAILPIVVTSYQDTRTGFFSALGLSLLLGAQNGNDYDIVLMGLVASAAAILALGFSKYRKRLANSAIFLFVSYFIGITTLGIIRYVGFHEILLSWGAAAAVSILTPMLAYAFILLFDSVFDVASEFKLIELSDLNNPILKKFAMRAPGSYHHSLQVSTLAEAAAEAIGANALLVRVGAYYHDIGKMFMPEYFVENQRGGKNPHDKLAPRISALILINHVKKGYEFARENGLPTVVCNFIIEHHGGSRMKFFYEKAKEQAAKGEEVLESDFRYPGRRPQSKETGILMLADSVEAMVRSIKEPTIAKIRNAVRNMVEEKIHAGDLDDCPLTMKDLRVIVETFSSVLMGMYHDRLEYPGQKELEKRPAIAFAQGGNGNES